MLRLSQIIHVHLEISSRCNASCPSCPRNLDGFPYNNGYIEHDMTLLEAQTIFRPEFLTQLKHILINGNFGDMVMNPDTIDIIEYFRHHNKNLTIVVSTNGAARSCDFWQSLAHTGAKVEFCIDGLADTHSWYRQNTSYDQVLRNAGFFIAAGGNAVWKMIEFDHNRHQIPEAKALSRDLGFRSFRLVQNNRTQGPVFDRHGKLIRIMGQATDYQLNLSQRLQDIQHDIQSDTVLRYHKTRSNIQCQSVKDNSIYISSTGDVYPCCFLGFAPKTFGRGTYFQAAHDQFQHMIQRNNALNHDLTTCIQWFDKIAQTWNINSLEKGRLLLCNNNCGQKA